MKIIKNLFTIVILLATTISCSKAVIEDPNPPNTIDKIIKYNPDVETVMFNNCITCHGGSAPSASVTLTNYIDVRYYTESGNLIDRINDNVNPMPASGLMSTENRLIIEKWKQDGFLEN